MHILGISAYYHDSAAALISDEGVVAAAQEERFTRVKHDEGFPSQAVDYVLSEGGISASDLNCVVFYEKPFLHFERLLETYLSVAPKGLGQFLAAMPAWLKNKLWIKDKIRRALGYGGMILFPEHHESHAAAAFYPSPFRRAAFLTLDGVGEWATASYGLGSGDELELIAEQRFPHSLGLLYSTFTHYAGFRVNSGEYKLMGLAPYGEPRYRDLILGELLDLKSDGSFRLNTKYFGFLMGLTMTNHLFNDLFGGVPRKPEDKIRQKDLDIASSIQVVTEEIVLRMANHVHQVTGVDSLCLGGGVALNCSANGRLLREGPFSRIWVQPAAGDAGGALGAALYARHKYFGRSRESASHGRDCMKGGFLGPSYEESTIKSILTGFGARFVRFTQGELIEKVSRLIADGKVVGWFQGRMEFGPRALGNRSILADPRNSRMQAMLNEKIKFREEFRPFAPAVPLEFSSEYFSIGCESPYMMMISKLADKQLIPLTAAQEELQGLDKMGVVRSTIPSVTHVDGSARVQTVTAEANPLFHELLMEFGRLTGCPVLINTSFNVRGEPIVNTPEDAYRCFMATGIDYLAIGQFLLDKQQQGGKEGDYKWCISCAELD